MLAKLDCPSFEDNLIFYKPPVLAGTTAVRRIESLLHVPSLTFLVQYDQALVWCQLFRRHENLDDQRWGSDFSEIEGFPTAYVLVVVLGLIKLNVKLGAKSVSIVTRCGHVESHPSIYSSNVRTFSIRRRQVHA